MYVLNFMCLKFKTGAKRHVLGRILVDALGFILNLPYVVNSVSSRSVIGTQYR